MLHGSLVDGQKTERFISEDPHRLGTVFEQFAIALFRSPQTVIDTLTLSNFGGQQESHQRKGRDKILGQEKRGMTVPDDERTMTVSRACESQATKDEIGS